jgi:agmatine deiminase
LRQGISVLPLPQDDSWVRDTGPSFLVHDDGRLGGVAWTFNGWGEVYADHAEDAAMARRMLDHVNAEAFTSPLVLEGGGIHVDGEGTALLCAGSGLEPLRNPGLDRAAVEQELAALVAVDRVIWLEGSLDDDETRAISTTSPASRHRARGWPSTPPRPARPRGRGWSAISPS